ncbi:MAG TPA: NAD(P)H-dependent oxidoreductase, partial [Rhabdaerophilum sp.]|nr:NAD(P)H-dependent oxidoreductase [Rhabdaerophilum sp.]
MRILYLYCHPLEESFHAAIRDRALTALRDAGHEVDLLDLYADGFNPVLDARMRRDYHDLSKNRDGIEDYIRRLHAAEALVVQFPTWCFGFPAMLKGFFDRVFGPGITFDLSDPANVKPMLTHIRHVVGISTYGRDRWRAFLVGN